MIMSFTPLGDTLHEKMDKDSALKKQLEGAEIVEIAESVLVDIFGSDHAKHAKPLFLKNRTITISCTSSAMAQEIRLNQAEIVKQINKKLGSSEVDRIRYLA